jgi:hypothetical protein
VEDSLMLEGSSMPQVDGGLHGESIHINKQDLRVKLCHYRKRYAKETLCTTDLLQGGLQHLAVGGSNF